MANPKGVGGFKKGVSGNKSGRPKEDPEFKALCRQHSIEAVQTWLKWMRSDDGSASIKAAQLIAEHAHGKPTQQMDLEHTGNISINVSFPLKEKEPAS